VLISNHRKLLWSKSDPRLRILPPPRLQRDGRFTRHALNFAVVVLNELSGNDVADRPGAKPAARPEKATINLPINEL
jgi:hypothetical protein